MVLEPSWIHIERGADVKDVWIAGLLKIGQGKLGTEISCQFFISSNTFPINMTYKFEDIMSELYASFVI